jgi:hypothetical protein
MAESVGAAGPVQLRSLGACIAQAIVRGAADDFADSDEVCGVDRNEPVKRQNYFDPSSAPWPNKPSVETKMLIKELKGEPCDDSVLEESTEDSDDACDEDTCDEDTSGVEDDTRNDHDQDPAEDSQDWEWQSVDSVSSAASLCPSEASMDSLVDFYSPEETLIIFDWDDTICPTTALSNNSEVDQEAVKDLVSEAKKTIEKARDVAAEVIIVTNATSGWVELSCERWMPDLLPTIDTLEFLSARSAWEPAGITTPTGWKEAAFEDCISKFYSRYSRQSWKNIIVVGDSNYEHDALDQVAKLAPQGPNTKCRAKSIRFSQQPSLAVLARELQILREHFEDIVCHDDNLDLQYNSESI